VDERFAGIEKALRESRKLVGEIGQLMRNRKRQVLASH
jgi:hypothetical protein